MNRKRIGFSVLFIVIFLMMPMVAVTDADSTVMTDKVQSDSGVQENVGHNEHYEEDDKSPSPRVISLNGNPIDELPDFVYLEEESVSENPILADFALAAVDPSKPNITAVYYQNMTAGDGNWVTWMQPGGVVKIWFKVKGPITISGVHIQVRFTNIVSESSAYGSLYAEADLNPALSVDLDVNDTVWFSWQI
ncbi:MAG: hypothetical protein ACFFER_15780, partial [Candidatus Thorarchaeota archaeon]